MRLPRELQHAIEREVEKVERTRLNQACAQLTEQYQAARFSSPPVATEAHRAAYLTVRLPATYAVNLRVFEEIKRRSTGTAINTMLDLGAGPGTALHAAREIFPELQGATLVESDAGFISMGKRLGSQSSAAAVRESQWIQHDLKTVTQFELHDLVVISYALGELPQTAMEKLISRAWAATQKLLVIIEPGTVRGFGFIHAARAFLIASGAHVLAPCPHALTCPMAAVGDWCHFAERVERTSLHRQLKGGSLGYEDEKFSYIVASREVFPWPPARIVRHPRKNSGHVKLTLCTPEGLKNPVISKSQKESYKKARKAEWGDEWQPET
jgi:ribosomal protein RSM22 (predicted rRNA methylase)